MAKNILETVYGLGDDDTIKSLKSIDKIVGKLDTEKKKESEKEEKERKQDKLHENRLAQLKKRQKADETKQAPFTELMGKEKEKKGNDLWKWLLGAGVIGGGALAWMNRDKIGEWLGKKFDELKAELSKKINEWAQQLSNQIRGLIYEVTTPQGPRNPQEETDGTRRVRELGEFIERNLFGRGQISQKTRESRAIRQGLRYQDLNYSVSVALPGGAQEEEKALLDFYRNSQETINGHLHLLKQYDNMSTQMEEQKKLLENSGDDSAFAPTLLKRIENLRSNLADQRIKILKSEVIIRQLAAQEKKLLEAENKALGRPSEQSVSAFTGSQFVEKKQTGGMTGQKFRKGNGAPTEYLMDPWVDPQKRQNGGKIFLHWAASEYNYSSPAYHATVQGDGSVKKERDYNTFGGGHTSERNSEGIGLSLAAMKGATSNDFGRFPVKKNQYESMAKLAASILTSWGYGPSYVNDRNVPTHAEAGRQGDSMGNYGPTAWGGNGERWDLYMLYQGDTPGSGGPKIRNKIKGYMASGDYELETTDGDGHNVPSMPAPARQKTFMEKLQEAFGALGNVGIFGGTILKGIGSFLLEKLGIDLSGMFSMFGMGQPEQKQEGGLIKGNAKAIYDRLIMGGMSIPASRGILANIGVETAYTYDPKTVQDDGGPGRGLVQWEKGGRYDTDRINLVDFAKKKGTTWDDLNTQVDFILHEMNTHPEYMRLKPKLNASKNTREATELFLTDYEKASRPHTDRRFKVADQLDKMNWVGPRKVGPKVGPAKVGPKIVGTGNPVIDFLTGKKPEVKQSGGNVSRSSTTKAKHTNFQQNQQVFNQSRGKGRRQIVVVKRNTPSTPLQLPTPAPPQAILPSGGVNNIDSINEMYSVVGMS